MVHFFQGCKNVLREFNLESGCKKSRESAGLFLGILTDGSEIADLPCQTNIYKMRVLCFWVSDFQKC